MGINATRVRACKVGTTPECVQLYRGYKLRPKLLIKYRPLHIEASLFRGLVKLLWEPRERHWSSGVVDYVDKTTGHFRINRLQ